MITEMMQSTISKPSNSKCLRTLIERLFLMTISRRSFKQFDVKQFRFMSRLIGNSVSFKNSSLAL